MMKRFERFIAVFLMVVVFCNCSKLLVEAKGSDQSIEVLSSTVMALDSTTMENVRATTFLDTSFVVECTSAGMDITIHTSMTKEASVVGVKDIVIERKVGLGWVTVATATGGEVYNSAGCAVTLLYEQAIYDETYRISCVHYANVDGYRELEHVSGNIKFIY